MVVCYSANGGDFSGETPYGEEVALGSTITLVDGNNVAYALSKEGHHATKWNSSEAGDGTDYGFGAEYTAAPIEGSYGYLNLYAYWVPNAFTVVFYSNHENVQGSMENQEFTYGQEGYLAPCGFTLEGYHFDYWLVDLGDGSENTLIDEDDMSAISYIPHGVAAKLMAQW